MESSIRHGPLQHILAYHLPIVPLSDRYQEKPCSYEFLTQNKYLIKKNIIEHAITCCNMEAARPQPSSQRCGSIPGAAVGASAGLLGMSGVQWRCRPTRPTGHAVRPTRLPCHLLYGTLRTALASVRLACRPLESSPCDRV